jgi:serine/threonine protein kinase
MSKLRKEALLLSNLRHLNIILFNGVIWEPPDFGIAMPLVPHGSLDSFIDTYENLIEWPAKVSRDEINYVHVNVGIRVTLQIIN